MNHNEHVVAWYYALSEEQPMGEVADRIRYKAFQEEDFQRGVRNDLTYEEYLAQPTYGEDDYDSSWMDA